MVQKTAVTGAPSIDRLTMFFSHACPDVSLRFAYSISICARAPLPLRLIVGFGFQQHGFAKLSKGPDAFAAILQAMGVPAPHMMAWATISREIGGSLAVLLGALVALAAVPWQRFSWLQCYRAPALWIQLAQINCRDRGLSPVRSPGLRV